MKTLIKWGFLFWLHLFNLIIYFHFFLNFITIRGQGPFQGGALLNILKENPPIPKTKENPSSKYRRKLLKRWKLKVAGKTKILKLFHRTEVAAKDLSQLPSFVFSISTCKATLLLWGRHNGDGIREINSFDNWQLMSL